MNVGEKSTEAGFLWMYFAFPLLDAGLSLLTEMSGRPSSLHVCVILAMTVALSLFLSLKLGTLYDTAMERLLGSG